MKKILIFVFIFLGFGIKDATAATNQCTLQDKNIWEYKTTIVYQNGEDIIEAEDKGYDFMFCCTSSNGDQICDYYIGVDTETNENTNDEVDDENVKDTGAATESNNTTNVDYCKGLNSVFIIIGHVVRLAKILIPIVIIGFGMMDFFKAVIGSKDDEIKKSIKSLIFRCISGVCIFFLPAFIDLIFSWVDGWETGYKGQYENCFKCIWNVGSCK